jgi:DNA-binding response OmpR family regulator
VADLLLVDNDERLTGLIAVLLERRGHAVRRACSFAEARAQLVERGCDLMLADLELGRESGREEIPRLAAEGLLPPTLIVSGYLDRDLDARLSAVPGVLGTLAKPFDLERLCERIDGCLAPARSGARGRRAGP